MIKPIITRIAEGLRAFTSTRPLGQPMARADQNGGREAVRSMSLPLTLEPGLAPNAIQ